MTTLPLNVQSKHLTIPGRSGKPFTKKQGFLTGLQIPKLADSSGGHYSERNKGGDRANTKVKVAALIAIAVEGKQVQTDTDEQEKDEHHDPPDTENRLFQFDGRSLLV
ncbi:hypothetical protein M2403_000452 [Rahnella sp. BIGb0603]|nr:hypothetical protein [Rahnella sp. BIGb0603]MCS3421872.1 hypothetical protein [Rahnella sp. BIGb0603]